MSMYQQHPDALSVEQNGETAVLHSGSETYFAIDEVGTVIWKGMEQPVSLDELVTLVYRQFEVDEETCRRDIVDFLSELEKMKLILVHATDE